MGKIKDFFREKLTQFLPQPVETEKPAATEKNIEITKDNFSCFFLQAFVQKGYLYKIFEALQKRIEKDPNKSELLKSKFDYDDNIRRHIWACNPFNESSSPSEAMYRRLDEIRDYSSRQKSYSGSEAQKIPCREFCRWLAFDQHRIDNLLKRTIAAVLNKYVNSKTIVLSSVHQKETLKNKAYKESNRDVLRPLILQLLYITSYYIDQMPKERLNHLLEDVVADMISRKAEPLDLRSVNPEERAVNRMVRSFIDIANNHKVSKADLIANDSAKRYFNRVIRYLELPEENIKRIKAILVTLSQSLKHGTISEHDPAYKKASDELREEIDAIYKLNRCRDYNNPALMIKYFIDDLASGKYSEFDIYFYELRIRHPEISEANIDEVMNELHKLYNDIKRAQNGISVTKNGPKVEETILSLTNIMTDDLYRFELDTGLLSFADELEMARRRSDMLQRISCKSRNGADDKIEAQGNTQNAGVEIENKGIGHKEMLEKIEAAEKKLREFKEETGTLPDAGQESGEKLTEKPEEFKISGVQKLKNLASGFFTRLLSKEQNTAKSDMAGEPQTFKKEKHAKKKKSQKAAKTEDFRDLKAEVTSKEEVVKKTGKGRKSLRRFRRQNKFEEKRKETAREKASERVLRPGGIEAKAGGKTGAVCRNFGPEDAVEQDNRTVKKSGIAPLKTQLKQIGAERVRAKKAAEAKEGKEVKRDGLPEGIKTDASIKGAERK